MKKLNKEQKDLVIKKLEESGQFSNLVEKAKKDPDAGLSEKEWNKARQKVVKNIMRDSNSRYFQVAQLLREDNSQSRTTEWLYDHREGVGFVLILIGSALVFLDPGTFAVRGTPPKVAGLLDYLKLLQYLLNWGTMGWGGMASMTLGYLWSRHPKLFID